LSDRGVAAKAQLDAATTALRIAEGNLKSAQARRDVVIQQAKEGDVLAPTTGRVLTTPVTVGAVVMPGEPVATVAEGDYVLRLELPERHSRFLKVGDPVRVDPADLAKGADATGVVTLVHPLIADGRLRADAKLKGLGDYFVGQRVRVWISAGERSAFVVPADYIRTRFGVDDVELKRPDGSVVETPVQRGRATPRPDAPDDVEILSGLRAGDELVKP
ncbi:MAG: HlyD family efflux transporter periplasmic adaptor subunit, partial [Hyphomicrobiales bacterium]|nr:HlyD family efflux transporter periplasmic adaptor subunit [Hyphomicrobiales bacterium]